MEIRLIDLAYRGGPLMVPLMLCSIFSIAIILTKWLYLKKTGGAVPQLKTDIFNLIRKQNITQAIKMCESSQSSAAHIIKAGLLQYGASREEVKEAMRTESTFIIPKLEQGLKALLVMANIAPLIGLLGTVTGMAVIFQTISDHFQTLSPVTITDLAQGIWQSLLTTITGLIIAIASYLSYHFLLSRVEQNIVEMEQAASDTLNLLLRVGETQTPHTNALDE